MLEEGWEVLQLHQAMVAEEEFGAVQSAKQKQRDSKGAEQYACLVAVLEGADPGIAACPPELLVGKNLAVVGTLDVVAVRALPGEVLIGAPPDSIRSCCLTSAWG